MSYEFQALTNDFFQPEAVFQLEQPIRTADMGNFSTEPNKSPTTVLDLGSGTIQQGSTFKMEPHEQIWEFNASPIKQEENSNSDMAENFPPLNEDAYSSQQMCGGMAPASGDDYQNNFYKNTIESSCRFQYAPAVAHHPKGVPPESQSIHDYSHMEHSSSESRLNCKHIGGYADGYSDGVGAHYDEKFTPAEQVYDHCDPFSDIDISQLDYSSAKSVYNNSVNNLDSSAIVEDESVFGDFPTNHNNEHNPHSCYSQSNFQSYMFLPQH